MKVFRFIIVFTSIIAVVFNSVSIVNCVLLAIATVLTLSFTKRHPFHGNYTKYMAILVYWMPLVFMPAFHLATPIIKFYPELNNKWINSILEFGIPVFLFVIFVLVILEKIIKPPKSEEKKYHVKPISEKIIVIGLLFCILLSFFCLSIGLGRMGGEPIVLPFHLSGIINLFRRTMVPLLCAIVVENYYLRGKKLSRNIVLLYLFWCFVEIFTWMSKSIVIEYVQNVLLLCYVYYRPSPKTIVKIVAPLIALFLFLYPIIDVMRGGDIKNNFIGTFKEAKEISDEEHDSRLLAPLNRVFLFDAQYAQNYSYISESLFDFSKVPLLFASGGAAGFQTFVIDEYPPDAHHSSGTSGLMDSLLHGGKGLMYIFIFLLLMLAFYSDGFLYKKKVSVFVIWFFICFSWMNYINVSYFYDGVGLQNFIVWMVCIIIANYYNFSEERKSNIKKRKLRNV